MKNTRILFLVAVFSLLMIHSALASEPNAFVTLPIRQAEDAEINYILSDPSGSAPMPSGSENGQYAFSVKKSENAQIPVIHFTQYGTWHYVLTAKGNKVTVTPEKVDVSISYSEGYSPIVTAMLPTGEKCELDYTVSESGNDASGTSKSSSGTSGTSKGSDSSSPKTMDSFPLARYSVVCLGSFLIMAFLIGYRHKEKKQEKGTERHTG